MAASIDDLFAQTLEGDYDDERAWSAIHALRTLGTREVFERAAERCSSDDPKIRARGVDVLAQIGSTAATSGNQFPEESYSIVSKLILNERDVGALTSELTALGFIGIEDAVPLVASYADHADAGVRYAVASSLSNFPAHPLGIETLLTLMEDEDDDVRDWATFGIGSQTTADTPKIREALLARAADAHADVRGEALSGLAQRKDLRVIPYLRSELQDSDLYVLIAEAASFILEMDSMPDDWGSADYLDALNQKFPA